VAVESGPFGLGREMWPHLHGWPRLMRIGRSPGVSSLRSPAARSRPFRIWALIDNGAAPNVVAMGVDKDCVQRTAMQRWLE
jgi:hypothetical protein